MTYIGWFLIFKLIKLNGISVIVEDFPKINIAELNDIFSCKYANMPKR